MGRSRISTARRGVTALVLGVVTLGAGAPAWAQVPAGSGAPRAAAPAASEKSSDNIVVVLDASGSMKESLPGAGESKMEAAKKALLTVLSKTPAGTNVGVLVFSGHKVGNEWVYPLGPMDEDQLRRAVSPIQPEGGTPLGAYLKKGADALVQKRTQQSGYGTYRMLVVTDGEASDAPLVEKYTPLVLARGITLDVIGVNMKGDHTLARKVHTYRRANDPASLNSAVSEVFAELSTKTANDTGGADSFAMIQGLPDGLATAALVALTTAQTQPVGDPVPSPQQSPAPQAAAPAGSPVANPAPPTPAPNPAPAPTSAPSPGGFRLGLPSAACFIIGLVFLVLIVSRVAKAARGGKR